MSCLKPANSADETSTVILQAGKNCFPEEARTAYGEGFLS